MTILELHAAYRGAGLRSPVAPRVVRPIGAGALLGALFALFGEKDHPEMAWWSTLGLACVASLVIGIVEVDRLFDSDSLPWRVGPPRKALIKLIPLRAVLEGLLFFGPLLALARELRGADSFLGAAVLTAGCALWPIGIACLPRSTLVPARFRNPRRPRDLIWLIPLGLLGMALAPGIGLLLYWWLQSLLIAALGFLAAAAGPCWIALSTAEFIPGKSLPDLARIFRRRTTRRGPVRLPRSPYGPFRALAIGQYPWQWVEISFVLCCFAITCVLAPVIGTFYSLYALGVLPLFVVPKIVSDSSLAGLQSVHSWGIELREISRRPAWFFLSVIVIEGGSLVLNLVSGGSEPMSHVAIALTCASLIIVMGVSPRAILFVGALVFLGYWEGLRILVFSHPPLQLGIAIVLDTIALAAVISSYRVTEDALKRRAFEPRSNRWPRP